MTQPQTPNSGWLAVPKRELPLSNDEFGIHGAFDATALDIESRWAENHLETSVTFVKASRIARRSVPPILTTAAATFIAS